MPGTPVTYVLTANILLLPRDPDPPWLAVIAIGEVPTAGWTNPRLAPRNEGGLTPDGTLQLDFLADEPDGIVAQVITPVSASYIHRGDANEVRRIQIFSAAEQPFELTVGALPSAQAAGGAAEPGWPPTPPSSVLTIPVLIRDLIGRRCRLVRPDDVLTMDFDPNRATIFVDDRNIIKDIRFF